MSINNCPVPGHRLSLSHRHSARLRFARGLRPYIHSLASSTLGRVSTGRVGTWPKTSSCLAVSLALCIPVCRIALLLVFVLCVLTFVLVFCAPSRYVCCVFCRLEFVKLIWLIWMIMRVALYSSFTLLMMLCIFLFHLIQNHNNESIQEVADVEPVWAEPTTSGDSFPMQSRHSFPCGYSVRLGCPAVSGLHRNRSTKVKRSFWVASRWDL